MDEKIVESTVLVRRQIGDKDAAIEEEEKAIEVHKFITEPAKIHFEVGVTMNMGNYESARINVGVTVPCYQEELGEAYKYARGWVERIIAKEKAAIKGGAAQDEDTF